MDRIPRFKYLNIINITPTINPSFILFQNPIRGNNEFVCQPGTTAEFSVFIVNARTKKIPKIRRHEFQVISFVI
jgi:hypothetical protein